MLARQHARGELSKDRASLIDPQISEWGTTSLVIGILISVYGVSGVRTRGELKHSKYSMEKKIKPRSESYGEAENLVVSPATT